MSGVSVFFRKMSGVVSVFFRKMSGVVSVYSSEKCLV